MKIALITLSVLLLTILLISDSEEGWVRRAIRRVRVRVRVRVRRTLRRVNGWVRKHGPAIRTGFVVARFVGKRSVADNPCPDGALSQAKAQELLTQLKLTCPEFAIRPEVGLPKAVVLDAFEAVDDDNNDLLSDAELDNLENVLEAYQVCEQEAAKQNV